MNYTTLGRTGLRVSVAGLGCGGFSRLGKSAGKTEAESIALVQLALDHGINLIDTAAAYGTEEIVGRAIAGVKRDAVVLATKGTVRSGEAPLAGEEVVRSLENSLRRLGTDRVDVFQLHGMTRAIYTHAVEEIVPALLRARDAGKFRFLGITENASGDHQHAVLLDAVATGMFDTVMVAF